MTYRWLRAGLTFFVGTTLGWTAHAAELVVELQPGAPQRYSAEQLLARPDAQTVEVPNDVAYQRPMTYRAVPLASLLQGVGPGQAVQIRATDGFVAELDSTPLVETRQEAAQAWLAIETPRAPWPAMGEGKPSAGPFYVVWTQPQASGIRPEQWPYQTAEIRLTTSVAERFPAMMPANDASGTVQQGWNVFQVNCLVCHSMNRQGDARMGPDLNVPYSPVEYFAGDYLRQYIRDPGSLRHWPQASMPPFPPEVLRDPELDALLAYLTHMAGRKPTP